MITKATSKWISVNDLKPEKNKYVLIKTPFCKYPAIVGYYTLMGWVVADQRIEIENVEYWAEIF